MDKLNFFCINLSSRQDRWLECKREFSRQNMLVSRWEAIPRPENRRFGAGLSHREIIALAKENKWKFVGVFEDDIKFTTHDFQNKCSLVINELGGNDWYILYFGGLLGRGGSLKKENGLKNVFRVENMFEAHAVIYNEKFYDLYLEKHPCKYHKDTPEKYLDNSFTAFDQWYANYIQKKYPCYVTKKILVSQKDDFSDIEGRKVWRRSRAEKIFFLYKYGLGGLAEKGGKYIKLLLFYLTKIRFKR